MSTGKDFYMFLLFIFIYGIFFYYYSTIVIACLLKNYVFCSKNAEYSLFYCSNGF